MCSPRMNTLVPNMKNPYKLLSGACADAHHEDKLMEAEASEKTAGELDQWTADIWHVEANWTNSMLPRVDLHLRDRQLSEIDTVDMATLKVIKYRYIRIEQFLIHKEYIPDGEHYEGYESPCETNPFVDFDEHDYPNYNLYPKGDGGDDEVHLSGSMTPQHQQQMQQQALPYPSYFAIAPPHDMSPSLA
ncbi:hypothetical protein Scep_012429 [Stephania cephalantha]|uniref:Uncharacterized protein n=1 Tax=Stephania cephalantha TaxID=152367 RepID=A0AAP0JGI6_9MAGN